MILYLHGFLSTGNSYKAQWIRQAFASLNKPGLAVLTPTYPMVSPQASMAAIERCVLEAGLQNHQAWCVFGSSMGGFYGRYIAQRYGVGVCMINPALQPEPILRPHLGEHRHPSSGEVITLNESYLQNLHAYQSDVDPQQMALVLLDKGDEVIPYESAFEAYNPLGQVRLFEGGDHAFQHLDQAWPDMVRFVEQTVGVSLS
ncbi:MAG: YqiA/YcfP family alpha/beta fold hydrolase [Hydrogenovibrio sp.]